MKYLEARGLARAKRKNQTKAEKRFWGLVRNRRFYRLKMNRQFLIKYQVGNSLDRYFIADFFCHSHKTIIEIDGSIHDFQQENDLNREKIIKSMGINVIRFKNEQVLHDWDEVRVRLKNHFGIIDE